MYLQICSSHLPTSRNMSCIVLRSTNQQVFSILIYLIFFILFWRFVFILFLVEIFHIFWAVLLIDFWMIYLQVMKEKHFWSVRQYFFFSIVLMLQKVVHDYDYHVNGCSHKNDSYCISIIFSTFCFISRQLLADLHFESIFTFYSICYLFDQFSPKFIQSFLVFFACF